MEEREPQAGEVIEEARTQENALTLLPRHRSPLWRVLGVLLVVIFVLALASLLLLFAYRGPATLPATLTAMPGVPIFPYAQMDRGNRLAQMGMAIPLRLARLQGAAQADTVLLSAPGDRDFVLEWYRAMTPEDDWQWQFTENVTGGTRLVYLRGKDEGLQITIGASDGLSTPVQLVYLQGMPAQMRTAFRK